jgi:Holliday junction resolvase RusA-like endonuclease
MRPNRGPIVLGVRRITPKGLGGSNEAWRQALLEASQKIPSPRVGPEAEFTVEATFCLLPQDRWHLVDLDNLAKPLLDTLFRPRQAPASADRPRRLFDADDGQVVELILRKKVVQEERDQGGECAGCLDGGWRRPSTLSIIGASVLGEV